MHVGLRKVGEAGPQSRVVVSISCFCPTTLAAVGSVRGDLQTVLLLGYNGVQVLTLLLFSPGVGGRLRAAHAIFRSWRGDFDTTFTTDDAILL